LDALLVEREFLALLFLGRVQRDEVSAWVWPRVTGRAGASGRDADLGRDGAISLAARPSAGASRLDLSRTICL